MDCTEQRNNNNTPGRLHEAHVVSLLSRHPQVDPVLGPGDSHGKMFRDRRWGQRVVRLPKVVMKVLSVRRQGRWSSDRFRRERGRWSPGLVALTGDHLVLLN